MPSTPIFNANTQRIRTPTTASMINGHEYESVPLRLLCSNVPANSLGLRAFVEGHCQLDGLHLHPVYPNRASVKT